MKTLMICLLLIVGCASLQADTIPALPNRTLRISETIPGFEYQYEVCDKKILGICVSHKWQKDAYDLNDVKVRQQLIDMGFVAHVKEQVK